MKLFAGEIGLLREVFAWARKNTYRTAEVEKGECARCRVWASMDLKSEVHIWDRLESTDDIGLFVKRNNTTQGIELRDVREVVDVLCAMRVLPARFSSQYAVGAASAAIQVIAEVGTAAAQRDAGDDV